MACLECGRQIDSNDNYQMKIGNFIYELCRECFKKSGAVEGAQKLDGKGNEE
ncbi:MAG: hypothetical protein JRI87_11785 [Deltaproteobacteria bacterium]|nr:hypothetical protein [Deltaproteobacteria bacterium]MBW1854360.1 hypothetical protein [Deltaproteobacteria bacterium]